MKNTKMHPPSRLFTMIVVVCGMFAPQSLHAQEAHSKPDAAWARISMTTEHRSGLGFGFGAGVRNRRPVLEWHVGWGH